MPFSGLKLPLRDAANQSIGNIGNAITSATQSITNFDPASIGKRMEEAGAKAIASGSELLGFKKLTKDVKIVQTPDVVELADNINNNAFVTVSKPAASATSPIELPTDSGANHVILSARPTVGEITIVPFNVMPRISESRSVEYDPNTPLHHPGAIQKYRSTSARTWSIAGTFISRNVEEATRNLDYLNAIRSWAMPFYGTGTAQDASFAAFIGAPPPIITLTAFGETMIGPVKTIMTSYNWDFPNDIDYMNTSTGEAIPVVLSINISLTETYSPAEYSSFDLQKFRQGRLGDEGAFSRPSPQQSSAETVRANRTPLPSGVTDVLPADTPRSTLDTNRGVGSITYPDQGTNETGRLRNAGAITAAATAARINAENPLSKFGATTKREVARIAAGLPRSGALPNKYDYPGDI